ncbi:MAG TPA: hypothetical protein VMU16_05655 [Candidatus Binataceae bacterium]|nr:hypothetical protein [Candidatus Binataceae bacterium]
MGDRVFVCRRCGKRLDPNADYVLTAEKHERAAEDREHPECTEEYLQRMHANEGKLPPPPPRR